MPCLITYAVCAPYFVMFPLIKDPYLMLSHPTARRGRLQHDDIQSACSIIVGMVFARSGNDPGWFGRARILIKLHAVGYLVQGWKYSWGR